MQTLTRTFRFTVPAAPGRVFPFLCPVREYQWIPGWRCELLHSASGVAEEDCVFRTDFPDPGPMTWVVSRYEPPARIEFACFVPDTLVHRLKIALTAVDGGTRLDWTNRWLAVGPKGDAWIANQPPEAHAKKMDNLQRLLTHYLATGKMLQP
ncbi:MAG TPA: SRPBCC family protein [Opitutaceae bacterium]|nr:SRPBCC family protein [Opitutaceae bacterium]